MKKILFFSRSELTDLYGPISKKLANDFEVVHVAYSNHEAELLASKYQVKPDYNFKNTITSALKDSQIDQLVLDEMDAVIIASTKGRFNLNAAIQSDRGFSALSNEEALLLAQIYYLFWKNIFENEKISVIYHEPPSLFFNHIAAVLAVHYGGKYYYDSMAKGEGKFDFIYLTGDDAQCPKLLNRLVTISDQDLNENKERIEKFITSFRSSYEVFLGDTFKVKSPYLNLSISALKFYIKNKLLSKQPDKLADNIEYYLQNDNISWRTLKNLINYKRHIRYDDYDESKDYYYYSMNLEPEATVLYLGDGIYENQIKLIKNAASQLPPNSLLYVKDHPHFFGYRSYKDYAELQKVPNIRLLQPTLSGKKVIKFAKGVIMVNGTAGLEGLLLNKPIFTFGNMYFNVSDRVHYIHNIRDLKEQVYKSRNKEIIDDKELHKFVLAYLDATYSGVVDFFMGRAGTYGIKPEENYQLVAKAASEEFK